MPQNQEKGNREHPSIVCKDLEWLYQLRSDVAHTFYSNNDWDIPYTH